MDAPPSNTRKTRILVSTDIPPGTVEPGLEEEGEAPGVVAGLKTSAFLFNDKNLSIIRKHKRRRRFRR